MKHFILIIVLFSINEFFYHQVFGSEPDTLKVIDFANVRPGAPPEEWKHVLPKKHRVYTNYSIERSIDGPFLLARSNSTASWLELDLVDIDVNNYSTLEWRWKVDRFPDVGWEQEPSSDDFALRIELVYDYKGSYKNILNIIRKGLITSIFKRYPPELIISYVWSINVPSYEPYASPNSSRTVVIPIESNDIIKSRWIKEKRDIKKDLELLSDDKKLFLKKIRIRSDTDHSSSIAESGLKYIYLTAGNQ